MRYTSFYTVKEQNYKAVESILPDSNLPTDVQEVMKRIIEDHKALVKQQKIIIEDQNANASALFHLFDDPIAQQGTKNNHNLTPENEEGDNNPSLGPKPDPKKRKNVEKINSLKAILFFMLCLKKKEEDIA